MASFVVVMGFGVFFCFFVLFFFFFGGGGWGLLCSFEKKSVFFNGKSNVNVLLCYYFVTIICACLCNEDRLED